MFEVYHCVLGFLLGNPSHMWNECMLVFTVHVGEPMEPGEGMIDLTDKVGLRVGI